MCSPGIGAGELTRAGVDANRGAGRTSRRRPARGWLVSTNTSLWVTCGSPGRSSRPRIGAAGHVVLDGSAQEVRDGGARRDLDHDRSEVGEVRHPQREAGKPRVVSDLGSAERRAQPAELRVRQRRRRHEPVGQGSDRVAARDRGAAGRVLLEQRAVHRRVGPEERDRGVEHRQLDVLSAGAPLAGEERGGDRLRRGVRGHLVADEVAQRGRACPWRDRSARRPCPSSAWITLS